MRIAIDVNGGAVPAPGTLVNLADQDGLYFLARDPRQLPFWRAAMLKELEQQIGPLPTGDSVADVARAGRLDRTLDLLEKKLGVRA